MIVDNDGPTPSKTTHRLSRSATAKSNTYNNNIQRAPPLSLRQFLRSATGVITGAQQWHPSGTYRPPIFHAYLSTEKRQTPEPVPVKPWIYSYKRKHSVPTQPLTKTYKTPPPATPEPTWHSPGEIKRPRPTSLSPEKKPQRAIHEPIWHPAGKIEQKPVPYFDPPNLRWSLQELLRSMPELRTKPVRTSRSATSLRTSRRVEDES